MEKIEKLTAKQKQQMIEFREEWRQIGLATGPANIDAIRDAINAEYAEIGEKPPVLWRCESPFMAQLVINILKKYSAVGANLRDNLGANLEFVSTWFWGSLDSFWIAYYSFPQMFLRKIHTKKQMERLDRYVTIAKNAFWFYPFSGVCFVCNRPTFIGMDSEWHLHATNRPAIEFSDGWKLYYVHGVAVPDFVVEGPQRITTKTIEDEKNAEVRRVMLDIFGWNKYLQGVEPIHQDRYGILYRREIPGDEPLVMVRLLNTTPEENGTLSAEEAMALFGNDAVVFDKKTMTNHLILSLLKLFKKERFKDYFLRVPPTMKTAHEAVAWTFDETPETYNPAVES